VTLLERLGAHVASGYGEGLPDPLRDAVRLHLADAVGAWIAARGTAEGRALLRVKSVERESFSGRVESACGLARSSEVDDIHLPSATTPGAIVVPTALMFASSLRRDGGTLAQAIAVGYDAMTRLGACLSGPSILYRGIWPTYLCAPLATAAVIARLLGFTERQAAHALAIALALSSPAVGRQAGPTMSRWLAVVNAARNGLNAAASAQNGFTGDLRLFEGDFFSSVYAISPDPVAFEDERPALPETSFKPWCAAKQTMAAAQALKEILSEGMAPSEVRGVVVGVPPPYLKMIDHGVVAGERASFLTSAAYQLALAAFDPDAALHLGQTPANVPASIGDFMAKVSVKSDEDLLQHYPKSWPARVTVTAAAGKREKLVLHVPGDPERPFDESRVADKFQKLTAPVAGERAAERLLERCLNALDEGPAALVGEIAQLEKA